MKRTYCKTDKAKNILYLVDDISSTLGMISEFYRINSVDLSDTHEMLEAINNEGVSSITDEYVFIESINNLLSNSIKFDRHFSDKPFDYYRPDEPHENMGDVERLFHTSMERIYKYRDRLLMQNI